jgi:DNA-binding CsgD family transcriptional regulator
MELTGLSEKSRAILEMIAKGHSYEQILVQELAWRYQDIFDAAAEALAFSGGAPPKESARSRPVSADGKAYHLDDIRQAHPHAYEKWTPAEDERLRQLSREGKSVKELADALQRQPGAIRSRLGKLGLGS